MNLRHVSLTMMTTFPIEFYKRFEYIFRPLTNSVDMKIKSFVVCGYAFVCYIFHGLYKKR